MTDQRNRYTLAEASRLTGLSTEALRLRFRRGKLAGEKGNDGLRVILTSADIEAIVADQERQQNPTTNQLNPTGPVKAADNLNVLEEVVGILREQSARERAALEAEAATLREALKREQDRGDRAEARADKAEAERDAERVRADGAEREREEARVRAAAAEGENKGLREALAEVRKPFWRRWLG